MKKYEFLIFIVFMLFASCSKSSSPTESAWTNELKLDSTVNGANVIYPPNQKFSLELDLEADAGYQWDYTISDTTIVRIDSTINRPKSGNWNQVGGLTVETFYYQTMNTGKCTITLIEHQAWMPNVPPNHTVQFNVFVSH